MNRTMTVQTFWRDRVRQEWKIAFFSVMIIGLIAHTYKFTNTLLNHDSLYNGHNSQNMVTLGRWFLSVACGTGGYFDLPWMNGILSLFWIGLTAAVIVDIFEIRDPVVIVLAGGLLVSFPCITNTFFYEYTADGYMLAMLLSALTLWLSRMRDEKKSHILLAALCICFSCGTYQAYVSFALMLSICYLLWQFLTAEPTNHEAWLWVKKQIVIYGKNGHAEVLGLVGQTKGEAIVLEHPDDVTRLDFSKDIYLYSQTTKSLEEFWKIINYIQEHISPNAVFEYYDTICRQVANRMPHLQEFAKSHELIFFVSGQKSSNGRILYHECQKVNPNTHFVSRPEDIEKSLLKDIQSVGVCGATSTPKWLMEACRKRILYLSEDEAKHNP